MGAKFGHPILIQSKASCALQSSQTSSPRASLEGGKVFRDPIRRYLAVSVGSQDDAVPPSSFHKPSFGKVHRRASGGPGVRDRRRQSSFDDADVQRQTSTEPSGEARAPIGPIVGEYDNADQRRRNRSPRPIALSCESAQAGREALLFVFDGYCDNKAWSGGRADH